MWIPNCHLGRPSPVLVPQPLRAQIDSTAMLILKLSKNSTLADSIDPYEAEVLGQAIELLVEVMQGPQACGIRRRAAPGAEASHVPSTLPTPR